MRLLCIPSKIPTCIKVNFYWQIAALHLIAVVIGITLHSMNLLFNSAPVELLRHILNLKGGIDQHCKPAVEWG
jgi:hypothetical protein